MTQALALSLIRIDGGTQSRVSLSEQVVADYADKIAAGVDLPPPVIFFDGSDYWLADGFHRYMAVRKLERAELNADIRTGTRRDAVLYSVGANSEHGLPRSNEDKRRAVRTLLADPEWAGWSDREIARRCHVDHVMVGRQRELSGAEHQIQPRMAERNGKAYPMKTESIGKGQRLPADTRVAQIRELVAKGQNREQVAESLAIGVAQVSRLAFENKIEFGASGSHKVNHRRVVEQTVIGLDGAACALRTLPPKLEGITREEAKEWAEVVTDAIKTFTKFRNELKGYANA